MQLNITARHVEIPAEVRKHIEERVEKLTRFYDRILDVEVILGHEAEQFTAEMIVHVERKHRYVASDTGPDTYAIVDSISEKISRQLVKHKEKLKNHKHDGKPEIPSLPEESDEA